MLKKILSGPDVQKAEGSDIHTHARTHRRGFLGQHGGRKDEMLRKQDAVAVLDNGTIGLEKVNGGDQIDVGVPHAKRLVPRLEQGGREREIRTQ